MTHDLETTHPYQIVAGAQVHTAMYMVVAQINADMARDLLLHNREPKEGEEATNRKASPTVVKDYAAAMVAGQWYLSPQPIVLSAPANEGDVPELIDGQQRLKALVLASQVQPDLTVAFTFMFDAPHAAKWLLDQGKRRQPGDFLRMVGERNGKQLADAVKMLYAVTELRPFKTISLWRNAKLTPNELSEFLSKHGNIRQALTVARDIRMLVSPHVGAVTFYLMSQEYGPFLPAQFFDGLRSGANLDVHDPRLKLRDHLSRRKFEKYTWDGFEMLGLMITAVNAWLVKNESYRPASAFTRTSKAFPRLIGKAEMPEELFMHTGPLLNDEVVPSAS